MIIYLTWICHIWSLWLQILWKKKEVKQQHQSESIALKLDSTILNKLHREAEQKDISVNTLVSHIIRRHIDWHSNAAKLDLLL
jgi:vacuolar-type H+-ATPase subunit C/Vma6